MKCNFINKMDTIQCKLKELLVHGLGIPAEYFGVDIGLKRDSYRCALTASVNFGFMVVNSELHPSFNLYDTDVYTCAYALSDKLMGVLGNAISSLSDNELIILVSHGKIDARCLKTTLGSLAIDRFRAAIYYVKYANETKVDNSPEDIEAVFEGYYESGIKDVIFNGPATIVLWSDGTKTVVKAQNGEPVDHEKGLAMAIIKKAYANKGCYYELFKKWCPEEKMELNFVQNFNLEKFMNEPLFDSAIDMINAFGNLLAIGNQEGTKGE